MHTTFANAEMPSFEQTQLAKVPIGGRETLWALVAQRAVRPVLVVLAAVVLNDYAGFGQRPELLPVEALVAQASMEALDEAILPRTAGLDIDRLDLIGGQPSLDFLGDKLGTIVTPQVGGRSVLGDGPPDPFEHIAALESTVGPQHMTLTGVFVQDRQHT